MIIACLSAVAAQQKYLIVRVYDGKLITKIYECMLYNTQNLFFKLIFENLGLQYKNMVQYWYENYNVRVNLIQRSAISLTREAKLGAQDHLTGRNRNKKAIIVQVRVFH